MFYISTDTPVGDFHMLAERDEAGRDIVRASGFGSIKSLRQRLPERLQGMKLVKAEADHPYKKLVSDYFTGDKTALGRIPCAQEGSGFYRNVWRAINNVEHGRTISYKQLAIAAGHPAAIRPAGTVCGLNRLILLVPCHRVVKSDGGVGNYLYGSYIKEYLLKMEKGEAV